MLSEQKIAELKPQLMALEKNELLTPRQPVDIDVQECIDTRTFAMDDRAQLEAAGLDFSMVEKMDILARTYTHYAIAWEQASGIDPEALRQVPRQSGRPTHSRLVMDLACLVALARRKPEPLEAVHFDSALTAQARELAESLPRVLTAKRTTTGDRTWRDTRDRACTFLRMALSEVGECARTAFRDDTDRLRPYLHRTTHGRGAI